MTIEDKIFKIYRQPRLRNISRARSVFENSGIDWKGNLEIYSDVCDNVIFWSGWNEKVVSALLSLQSQGKIEKEPLRRYYIYFGRQCYEIPCRKEKHKLQNASLASNNISSST